MTNLFHCLQFHDPDAAMTFLQALGFTEAAAHRDDEGTVVHAVYRWHGDGGVMFGAVQRAGDTGEYERSAGTGQCYCVVEQADDVDRVHEAALAAGGTSVRAPNDPEYGGRECTVKDAEGNQWSFGTYPGA